MTEDERLSELETWKKSTDAKFMLIPTKPELEELVHKAMFEALKSVGITTKTIIITIAVIFGALLTIGGALKIFLGWLGIIIMRS